MILTRVDLPAPFSPTRAWTSPGRKTTETSSRALTASNCLEMFCASIIGGRSARLVSVLAIIRC